MKVGIIGDVHIGASLSLNKKGNDSEMPSRAEDYDVTLRTTIKEMSDKNCKYIVFTGDIFEHRIPTIKQQERFSAALAYALSLPNIEFIFICIGNHDQLRTINSTNLSYLKELNLEKIRVIDTIEHIPLTGSDGEVAANLIIIPYRDRRWYGVSQNSEALELIEQEFSYAMGGIDNDAPSLVVGHMTIEGTLWMVEEYAELYNGNELVLPKSMFKDVNITIMGHVHTPGLISKNPMIAYVGSMEKRGGFESHKKKYYVVDFDSKKIADFDEPCREIYDLSLDFSEAAVGGDLLPRIITSIDAFVVGKEMKGSIVRASLLIQSGDEKFCDANKISDYLVSQYEISHCMDIKPQVMHSRQARDEHITERTSDVSAFRRYIENEFNSHPLKTEILEAGLEFFGYEVER